VHPPNHFESINSGHRKIEYHADSLFVINDKDGFVRGYSSMPPFPGIALEGCALQSLFLPRTLPIYTICRVNSTANPSSAASNKLYCVFVQILPMEAGTSAFLSARSLIRSGTSLTIRCFCAYIIFALIHTSSLRSTATPFGLRFRRLLVFVRG
jgi:hypothetical protein